MQADNECLQIQLQQNNEEVTEKKEMSSESVLEKGRKSKRERRTYGRNKSIFSVVASAQW